MTHRSTLPMVRVAGIATGIASGIAALVVAAVPVTPPIADPIDPVGTWDVPAFAFTASNVAVANHASISGGEMTIERTAGCHADDCDLVISAGPDLVDHVVLRPHDGRSRYVGDEVLVSPSCNGAAAPPELTRGRFVTEAAHGSSELAFVIESELTGPWHGCEPFAFRYEAIAARRSPVAVAPEFDRDISLAAGPLTH